LVRVEEAISFTGNRLVYINGLREKAKNISFERNRQKEDLRQHQGKILPVFEELQEKFERRKILKQAYAEQYEGGLWDRAIMIAYAQNKTLTFGELKRMGEWLQSDEVVYAVEEVPDLIHWMREWRPYLEGSEDERNVYNVSRRAISDLKILQSTDSIEDPYMVNLLSLMALEGKTLREYVEETHKKLLLPEYLKKTLMPQKNKVTVELKKRLERDESLAEQLLRPVTLYPRFVVAGVRSDVTDLSQSTVNLAQSGLMDSVVLSAPIVFQIQEEGAPSVSSPSFPYQMEMDPDNTYVYDIETRRYLPATSETVLPSLFIRMERAVDKGWFYNARSTTLLVLGESSGFVHVNEDDTTGRGFHILQKTETPFSLVKKDSAQVGTQAN